MNSSSLTYKACSLPSRCISLFHPSIMTTDRNKQLRSSNHYLKPPPSLARPVAKQAGRQKLKGLQVTSPDMAWPFEPLANRAHQKPAKPLQPYRTRGTCSSFRDHTTTSLALLTPLSNLIPCRFFSLRVPARHSLRKPNDGESRLRSSTQSLLHRSYPVKYRQETASRAS